MAAASNPSAEKLINTVADLAKAAYQVLVEKKSRSIDKVVTYSKLLVGCGVPASALVRMTHKSGVSVLLVTYAAVVMPYAAMALRMSAKYPDVALSFVTLLNWMLCKELEIADTPNGVWLRAHTFNDILFKGNEWDPTNLSVEKILARTVSVWRRHAVPTSFVFL